MSWAPTFAVTDTYSRPSSKAGERVSWGFVFHSAEPQFSASADSWKWWRGMRGQAVSLASPGELTCPALGMLPATVL